MYALKAKLSSCIKNIYKVCILVLPSYKDVNRR